MSDSQHRTGRCKVLAYGGWLALATAAAAQESQPSQRNPYARADETWISINGTVAGVDDDRFVLDYGGGQIVVEMDDRDRDADAYPLVNGDRVTVSGKIDDDYFERTSIEASAVYIDKVGAYFYASARDEENHVDFPAPTGPAAPPTTSLVGTVTAVEDDRITLSTGGRSVTVEVDGMAEHPLDDQGYQRIRVGDLVNVSGHIDRDFFASRVVEADDVTSLYNFPG